MEEQGGFFLLCCFVWFLINWEEACYRGEGWIWKDWEVRGIEGHNVKFPTNQ